jgi:hypothetical protein
LLSASANIKGLQLHSQVPYPNDPDIFNGSPVSRSHPLAENPGASRNRAMREYSARRGWAIALQVRAVNFGAARREAREKLLEDARRREIDLVLLASRGHSGNFVR